MSDIVMPRLSDTMEEGTILRWLKQDGERVGRGEQLVEIETDKANMTYESDRDGVLQIVAREGDTLAVGEPIARIVERADARPAQAHGNGAPPQQARARVKASPLARRIARQSGVDLGSLAGSGPGGRIVKADVESSAGAAALEGGASGAPAGPTRAPEPPAPVPEAATTVPKAAAPVPEAAERETAAPLRETAAPLREAAARETAAPVRETAAPVPETTAPAREAAAARTARAAPEPAGGRAAPSAPTIGELSAAKGELTVLELSRTQRTIARRMAESKATIPHFSLSVDVDMQRCAQLRDELKRLAQSPAGDGTRVPTYNDMVVKACALALREHPRANGSYRDGRFELHARVNVGVAVAVDAEDALHSALVVPTVFDADSKSLGEIARETRTLAERVRDGSITPPQLSGATFTVSNLGMYGVRSFAAIVNPPQAAILAVGAVEQRAVALAGETAQAGSAGEAQTLLPRAAGAVSAQVVVRHTMTVTLSCDHRILYGADAALFLARIRELLEEPAALTL